MVPSKSVKKMNFGFVARYGIFFITRTTTDDATQGAPEAKRLQVRFIRPFLSVPGVLQALMLVSRLQHQRTRMRLGAAEFNQLHHGQPQAHAAPSRSRTDFELITLKATLKATSIPSHGSGNTLSSAHRNRIP